MALFFSFVAVFIVSLISLSGALMLVFRKKFLEKSLLFLVAFSAGSLMGSAFLHILPEASQQISVKTVLGLALLSFILFFFLEKVLHWRHCHKGECQEHVFGYLNLVGDSFHNFLDGAIIFSAFLTDFRVGVLASLAVALHEIPQEIGDFGVLVYSGFSAKKALALNFLTALTAFLGLLAGYVLTKDIANLAPLVLALAGGGFLYIGASDLLPEIKKEANIKKSMALLCCFLAGVLLMYLLGVFLEI